ncbi:hypothetical protein FGB62_104g028 [Gracilaria domingensis]|nr:hypothetical protein FGB62_104g028 [Gracilaria domingensis]
MTRAHCSSRNTLSKCSRADAGGASEDTASITAHIMVACLEAERRPHQARRHAVDLARQARGAGRRAPSAGAAWKRPGRGRLESMRLGELTGDDGRARAEWTAVRRALGAAPRQRKDGGGT